MVKPPKLLLIGWDAADWATINPLLDAGELPYLQQLMDRGTHGPLSTLSPVLSPMLWATISTGQLADRHGIHGFTTVDPKTGLPRPYGSTDRTARALWNIASNRGLKSHVVNWFCSHPPEPVNGIAISDLVSAAVRTQKQHTLPPHCVHPKSYAKHLEEWIFSASEIDSEFIRLFVPHLGEMDQAKTTRLTELANVLAESITVHNATTWIAENEEWDVLACYYPLIDHVGHAFMPFHPPQQDFVGDFEYRMYNDVVNSAYRFSDLMLGRLMALAGPEANIVLVSDHGFYNDHRRVKPSDSNRLILDRDHSQFGIFVASGPAFKAGSNPIGANLLDIAPTILNALNLPAGRDMPGRSLLEVMNMPSPIPPIDSWEQEPGNFFECERDQTLDSNESKALLDNFVQMGYVDPAAAKGGPHAQSLIDVNNYNLARVYASSDRHDQALDLLIDIVERNPLRLDMALSATESYLALGLLDESRELLQMMGAIFSNSPRVLFFQGLIEMYDKRYAEALECFTKLEEMKSADPVLFVYAGQCALQLKDLEKAATFFELARVKMAENPAGVLGLAEIQFRMGQYSEATLLAFTALNMQCANVAAHLMLGKALAHQGKPDEAIIALEQVLAMKPMHYTAHRYLKRLYQKQGNAGKAQLHESVIENAQFWRQEQKHKRQDLRNKFKAMRKELESELDEPTEAPTAESTRLLAKHQRSKAQPRVIVSGMPRSGTSLVMQMLDAAGLELLTDAERPADQDNPKGYLEYKPITQLATRSELLDQMDGKAVKVISGLLVHLKFEVPAKVIYIKRDTQEIADSQNKMVIRLTGKAPKVDRERYLQILNKHANWSLNFLKETPTLEPLFIEYRELIETPAEILKQIAAFLELSNEQLDAMRACIDPSLYRNRH